MKPYWQSIRLHRVRVAAVAAVALAAVLSAPPASQAGRALYEGPVLDTDGRVDFVVKRKDGRLRIRDFHANELPARCPLSVETFSFGVRRIKVDRERRFTFADNVGGPGARGSRFAEIDGRIRRGGRASGTVRFKQTFDGISICDTGTLEWKASR